MILSEQLSRTALSVLRLKDALLYFKYVVPLSYTFDVLNDALAAKKSIDAPFDLIEDGRTALNRFIKYSRTEVIPPELRIHSFFDAMTAIGEGHLRVLFSDYWRSEDNQSPDNVEIVANDLIGPAKEMLKGFSITDLPAVLPPELINLAPNNSADISVTLASLELIDTTQTPLAQIYEFRRDEQAAEKLRRLRMFAYENYCNKPRTLIEDDLLTRISEYENTVKKWGFEKKAAVLTALMDSRLIAGGIAGSFLSTYLGSPLPAIATALGAGSITIGKIAIELGRQQFAYRELLAKNPVSYIAYAKEKIRSR